MHLPAIHNQVTWLLFATCICGAAGGEKPAAPVDAFNVVWDSPSTGANGSMPLGNGEVGVNLWVEKDGDLRFYVARTDAWSECSQLLKLGRVRLAFTPNPFTAGLPFRQTLNLRSGCVKLAAGSVALRVLVDAQSPVVYVTGHSTQPISVRASVELWRTQRRDLKAEAKDFPCHNAGSWTMRGAQYGPKDAEAWESADVLDDGPDDAVVWYHRNAFSIVPFTLKHQGLESVSHLAGDPLLHRTFGGWMSAAGFVRDGQNSI